MGPHRPVWALFLVGLAFTATTTQAQEREVADTPDTRIGHAADALPGYGRVALPRAGAWLAAVSASGGYGFTESVLGASDSHHRLRGRIAVGLQPIDWLAFSLRVDGRYDTHTVGMTSDDGLVGDPRLTIRAGGDLGGFFLGGQATLWIPGVDAPSLEFAATTIDLSLLAGLAASEDLTFALNLGARIDNSAATLNPPAGVPPGQDLSPADHMSLGVSPNSAFLLGIGGAYRLEPAEIFVEFTWDMILGNGAPDVTQSPMRVGLGGRLWLGDTRAIQLELGVEVATSGRPPVVGGYLPLMPIEPRFGVNLGVTFRFPEPDFPEAIAEGDDDVDDDVEPEDDEAAVTVRGTIRDEAGQPIQNAEVIVTPGGGEAMDPVTTGTDGSFEVAGVSRAAGGQITIRAEGYVETTQPLEIGEGEIVTPTVSLARDLPSGQLRGVVQSFTGEAVQATVRVDPLGQEVTVGADGSFEIDIPPGQYEIVITAPGYQEQRRPVTVEQQGVTILNVDLRRR